MTGLKALARDAEIVAGALLAALAVMIVTQASRWEYSGLDGPGPGFFPFWYGVSILGLSAGLVATRMARRLAPAGEPADWRGIGRALLVWTAFAACVALLRPLGFALSFALLTAFVVKVMYGRSAAETGAVAVLVPLALTLVFRFALGVDLPAGPLGF